MDGDVKEAFADLTRKLENTLEIVMEHFHEQEERMAELEAEVERLKNGD